MDNLAHAVVGAALGRVVAGRKVPAAGWIGAVAANAPDWTELLLGFRPYRGSIAYYTVHRGITHSFLGAAVETVAITGAMWALFAFRQRRAGAQQVSLGPLAALVTLAVFSHVYMDWQGSYGVRPWLPWGARWSYADWVAIADPLFWLLPLVGLAWGAERHWRDLVPFVLLAGLISWAVFEARATAVAWLLWTCIALLALGALGWVRHWFGAGRRREAAAWSLVVLAAYTAAQAVASGPVKASIGREAVRRFGAGATGAALTHVGTPFQWEAIYVSRDTIAGPAWSFPRHLDDERVQLALQTAAGRAISGFARFLAAEVDSTTSGTVVRLRDVRFARTATSGWGVVTVPLPIAGGSR